MFRRRLLCHQELPRRRAGIETESKLGADNRKHIVVRPARSEEERIAAEEAEQAEKETAFQREIGARRVFDLMAARGVPIVGHNMLLDCLFVTHAFDDGPPATVDEWAMQMRTLFPAGLFGKN